MKSSKRPYVMTQRAAKAEATRARIRASEMEQMLSGPTLRAANSAAA